jgi:protoporphyrinogen oxidase
MFSNDPYVHDMYRMLLGDNVRWQDREAWIYSKNVYTRYPFQGAHYGLPPDVLKECIVGAIEARFGSLQSKGKSITDCCADGVAESTAPLVTPVNEVPGQEGRPRNFEEFIYKVWGAGVAKHFAMPYNRKLWAVPLEEMETSWLGGRVPMPDLEEMIEGALRPVAKPMGPNARFGYPLRGGFQALMDGCLCRTSRVRCANLGVGRENLTEKHWIYYPEDTVFHRIFVQGNASPHCNPPGGFGLTCEITYSPHKPLPCEGEELIRAWLARHDIVLAGRYSEWEYYDS